MAKQATVGVVGGEELDRVLKRLGVETAQGKKKVITAAAMIIQDAAIENAPELTGNLKRSIIQEVLEEDADSVVVGVGPDQQGDAFYGLILEFGADEHELRPDKAEALEVDDDTFRASGTHPGLPARPWLRPAFDDNIDRALAQAARQVKGLLGL